MFDTVRQVLVWRAKVPASEHCAVRPTDKSRQPVHASPSAPRRRGAAGKYSLLADAHWQLLPICIIFSLCQIEVRPDSANLPATLDTIESAVVVKPKRNVTKLVETNCSICSNVTNRLGESEKCIRCNHCEREGKKVSCRDTYPVTIRSVQVMSRFTAHPSCYELSEDMLSVVLTYEWMCMECKVCVRCSDPGNEVCI